MSILFSALSAAPVILQGVNEGSLSEALSGSPLLAIGLLFGAGVLTSLTPCIYPMIPITVSVIAGCTKVPPR